MPFRLRGLGSDFSYLSLQAKTINASLEHVRFMVGAAPIMNPTCAKDNTLHGILTPLLQSNENIHS